MNISEVRSAIAEGKFNDKFNMLYGDFETAITRFCDALNCFEELYGNADNVRLFSAPGRTEIGSRIVAMSFCEPRSWV